jgi:hypothetical protein
VVTETNDDLPTTIDAAVRLMLATVPEDEQAKIAAMPEDELIMLHFGLGQWIRNHLGLWHGNAALLRATGESNPDDASGVIIHAFWKQLRNGLPKSH